MPLNLSICLQDTSRIRISPAQLQQIGGGLLVLLLGIFPASLMALCYQAIRLTLAS